MRMKPVILDCKRLAGTRKYKDYDLSLEVTKGRVEGTQMIRLNRYEAGGKDRKNRMFLTKQEALKLAEVLTDIASRMRG